jgi:hypothetical protein
MEPEQIIALYKEAFLSANPQYETAPHFYYSRGWFVRRDQFGGEHRHRRKDVEGMILRLKERAAVERLSAPSN